MHNQYTHPIPSSLPRLILPYFSTESVCAASGLGDGLASGSGLDKSGAKLQWQLRQKGQQLPPRHERELRMPCPSGEMLVQLVAFLGLSLSFT